MNPFIFGSKGRIWRSRGSVAISNRWRTVSIRRSQAQCVVALREADVTAQGAVGLFAPVLILRLAGAAAAYESTCSSVLISQHRDNRISWQSSRHRHSRSKIKTETVDSIMSRCKSASGWDAVGSSEVAVFAPLAIGVLPAHPWHQRTGSCQVEHLTTTHNPILYRLCCAKKNCAILASKLGLTTERLNNRSSWR